MVQSHFRVGLIDHDPLFRPSKHDARHVSSIRHRLPDAPACAFVRASDTHGPNITDLLLHPGSSLGHYVCVPPPHVAQTPLSHGSHST